MDRRALEEFAETGFGWFKTSGIGLDSIAEWCNEEAISTGDHRYWILGASFLALDEWWASYDARGGIGTNEYIALNESVINHLSTLLEERDPETGGELAGMFALRLQAVMDGRLPSNLYTHEDDLP